MTVHEAEEQYTRQRAHRADVTVQRCFHLTLPPVYSLSLHLGLEILFSSLPSFSYYFLEKWSDQPNFVFVHTT